MNLNCRTYKDIFYKINNFDSLSNFEKSKFIIFLIEESPFTDIDGFKIEYYQEHISPFLRSDIIKPLVRYYDKYNSYYGTKSYSNKMSEISDLEIYFIINLRDKPDEQEIRDFAREHLREPKIKQRNLKLSKI